MKAIVSSTILLTVLCGMTERAMAQVVPDNTVGTTVNQAGAVFNINNGIRSGTNLFHSFSQFSVPTGGSAIFNNATAIQNIFSRVTGNSLSSIDGLIKAQGSANLFLMNPNGIVFGPNARLDLGGSFWGTTANSIKFSDGIEFSAVNATDTPLLTVSAPIGLNMGSNPASINVQGTRTPITIINDRNPVTRVPSLSELRVKSGQTLALIGGNLNLNGATLSAEQGRIELGSVSDAGLVSLVPIAQGYTLGYANGQSFGDIQLTQKSLLDVSGNNAGSLQIQGRQIQFIDGSFILSQNIGNLSGGDLYLQASAGIDLIGANSGVRTETLGIGNGGKIRIITPRLNILDGANLISKTYGGATSGNIQVEASAVKISGSSTATPNGSFINSITYSSGNAGNLSVNGDSLLISNGAGLSSLSLGSGDSGEVAVRNMDTIVSGTPFAFLTRISSTTLGTGNAKMLKLDTARLQVLGGGRITASTFSVGRGGEIIINATESIQVSGRDNRNNSGISSAVNVQNPVFQQLLGLPTVTTADAGTVNITTPTLILKGGGFVSASNVGSGIGGNINITADTIQLKNQSLIEAQTASGNGGNIGLQVRNLLLLRDNSQITTTASKSGSGGNISIDSPVIVGLENSDIIANAVKGRGGNIQITTQGIFGLKYRDRLTPNNDITASSEFGINGNVQVNTIGINPANGLTTLPSEVVDSSRQIADRCGAAKTSSFVATGRGGIPQGPKKRGSDRTWHDLRSLTATNQPVIQPVAVANPAGPIVEASALQIDVSGATSLVAAKQIAIQPAATCGIGEVH